MATATTGRKRGDSVNSVTQFVEGKKGEKKKKWTPSEIVKILMLTQGAAQEQKDSSLKLGSFIRQIEKVLELNVKKSTAIEDRVASIANHILAIDDEKKLQESIVPILIQTLGIENHLEIPYIRMLLRKVPHKIPEILRYLAKTVRGFKALKETATEEDKITQIESTLFLKNEKINYPLYESIRKIAESDSGQEVEQSKAKMLGAAEHGLRLSMSEVIRLMIRCESSAEIDLRAHSLEEHFVLLGMLLQMPDREEGLRVFLQNDAVRTDFNNLRQILRQAARVELEIASKNSLLKDRPKELRQALRESDCWAALESIEHLLPSDLSKDPIQRSNSPNWAQPIFERHLPKYEPEEDASSLSSDLERRLEMLAVLLKMPDREAILRKFAKYLHAHLVRLSSASADFETFQLDSIPDWAQGVLAEYGFFKEIISIDIDDSMPALEKSKNLDAFSAVIIEAPTEPTVAFNKQLIEGLRPTTTLYRGLSKYWANCQRLFDSVRFLQVEFDPRDTALERSMSCLTLPHCVSFVLKPKTSSGESEGGSSQPHYIQGRSLAALLDKAPNMSQLHLEGIFIDPLSLQALTKVLQAGCCQLEEMRLCIYFPIGKEPDFIAAIFNFFEAIRNSPVHRLHLELEFPPYDEIVPQPEEAELSTETRKGAKKAQKAESAYEQDYQAKEIAYSKRIELAQNCIRVLLKGLRAQNLIGKTITIPQWPLNLLRDLLMAGGDITLKCGQFFPPSLKCEQVSIQHTSVAFNLAMSGLKTPETSEGVRQILRGLFEGNFTLNVISTMRALNLSGALLESAELELLLQLLEPIESLNELNLSNCSLTKEHLDSISKMIGNRLMSLDLTDNNFSPIEETPIPPPRRSLDRKEAPPLPPRNEQRASKRMSAFFEQRTSDAAPLYADLEEVFGGFADLVEPTYIAPESPDRLKVEDSGPAYDVPLEAMQRKIAAGPRQGDSGYADADRFARSSAQEPEYQTVLPRETREPEYEYMPLGSANQTEEPLYGDEGRTVDSLLRRRGGSSSSLVDVEEERKFGFGGDHGYVDIDGAAEEEDLYDEPIAGQNATHGAVGGALYEDLGALAGVAASASSDTTTSEPSYMTRDQVEASQADQELYGVLESAGNHEGLRAARAAFSAANAAARPLPADSRIKYVKEVIPRRLETAPSDLVESMRPVGSAKVPQEAHPLERILATAAECTSLVALRLAGCGWSEGVLEACKDLLPKMPALRTLSIGTKQTSADEVVELMHILESTNVQHLHMPHQPKDTQDEIYRWNIRRCKQALKLDSTSSEA